MSGICGIRSPFQGFVFFLHVVLGLRPRLAYYAPLGLGGESGIKILWSVNHFLDFCLILHEVHQHRAFSFSAKFCYFRDGV